MDMTSSDTHRGPLGAARPSLIISSVTDDGPPILTAIGSRALHPRALRETAPAMRIDSHGASARSRSEGGVLAPLAARSLFRDASVRPAAQLARQIEDRAARRSCARARRRQWSDGGPSLSMDARQPKQQRQPHGARPAPQLAPEHRRWTRAARGFSPPVPPSRRIRSLEAPLASADSRRGERASRAEERRRAPMGGQVSDARRERALRRPAERESLGLRRIARGRRRRDAYAVKSADVERWRCRRLAAPSRREPAAESAPRAQRDVHSCARAARLGGARRAAWPRRRPDVSITLEQTRGREHGSHGVDVRPRAPRSSRHHVRRARRKRERESEAESSSRSIDADRKRKTRRRSAGAACAARTRAARRRHQGRRERERRAARCRAPSARARMSRAARRRRAPSTSPRVDALDGRTCCGSRTRSPEPTHRRAAVGRCTRSACSALVVELRCTETAQRRRHVGGAATARADVGARGCQHRFEAVALAASDEPLGPA